MLPTPSGEPVNPKVGAGPYDGNTNGEEQIYEHISDPPGEGLGIA